ncbi:MAG: hypothetical protein E3J65_04590 [Dehalococcoidia bacterium]|nr:MAG: hypothetical protein E3J65_04590 [Dehalococcoidia bacterium]
MNEETKELEGAESVDPLEGRIAELEGELAQFQQSMAVREEEVKGEVAALKEKLSSAAGKYRALILAGAPEVPEELVKGETPDEVEASFAAAREMVEKVRRQLEAKAQAERVPAGAPARTPPDLGALSPSEKIAYALATRQG